MTTADAEDRENEKITLSVDAATSARLKAAAAHDGVSVGEYCEYAIDRQLSEDDGGLRTKRKGKGLTVEELDKFFARNKERLGGKKFPGNSADVIREMREERALHLERVSKGS